MLLCGGGSSAGGDDLNGNQHLGIVFPAFHWGARRSAVCYWCTAAVRRLCAGNLGKTDSHKKILIVDDEPLIAMLLSE